MSGSLTGLRSATKEDKPVRDRRRVGRLIRFYNLDRHRSNRGDQAHQAGEMLAP
ncbi:MAG: hypothetical protein QOH59_711 [Gemmatimonadales bacterium]|jgi:hypothetical protein|nr:hypothetical protein [Gemmatimonadales bacterium]